MDDKKIAKAKKPVEQSDDDGETIFSGLIKKNPLRDYDRSSQIGIIVAFVASIALILIVLFFAIKSAQPSISFDYEEDDSVTTSCHPNNDDRCQISIRGTYNGTADSITALVNSTSAEASLSPESSSFTITPGSVQVYGSRNISPYQITVFLKKDGKTIVERTINLKITLTDSDKKRLDDNQEKRLKEAEEERIEEERKAKEEAAAKKAEQKAIANAQPVSYTDLFRNPDKYEGKYIKFTGRVAQVISDSDTDAKGYMIYTKKSDYGNWYEDRIFVIDAKTSGRILEDDIVTFIAKGDGLFSGETVLGAGMEVPQVITVTSLKVTGRAE